jgi:hypothetical protein
VISLKIYQQSFTQFSVFSPYPIETIRKVK